MANEAIIEAIQTIEATGPLTPNRVVDAARDPQSPLHERFTWDDTEAADRWRMEEARSLIREVKLIVTTNNVSVKVPMFVRSPEAGASEQGYQAVVALDGDTSVQAVRAELRRAVSALRRAELVALAVGMPLDLGNTISAIETVTSKIGIRKVA